ncbi:hypothetical protein B484DRAFT_389157, partial [Ochromonadaceae sp. CCMP2298]
MHTVSTQVYQRMSVWLGLNRGNFSKLGRMALFGGLGFFLIRKLSNWYSGMAEYELLLDEKDFLYQSQGMTLHGIGASLIASLNQTALQTLKLDSLCGKIVLALDRPCFPQMMRQYCEQQGRANAVLLSELDQRIRVCRRRVVRYRQAVAREGGPVGGGGGWFSGLGRGGATTEQGQREQLWQQRQQQQREQQMWQRQRQQQRGQGQGQGRNASYSPALYSSGGLTPLEGALTQQETEILLTFQRSLTVLQARQTDAFLRLTRTQVLTAANTCEDLLKALRARSAKRAHTLRLPVLRSIASKFAGLRTGVRAHTIGAMRFTLSSMNLQPLGAFGMGTGLGGKAWGAGGAGVGEGSAFEADSFADELQGKGGRRRGQRQGQGQGGGRHSHLARPIVPLDDKRAIDAEQLDAVLKQLNERERQAVLQIMQRNFYELAGRVQGHLDALAGIDAALAVAVDSPYASRADAGRRGGGVGGGVEDDGLSVGMGGGGVGAGLEAGAGWQALDGWISGAAVLCSQA